MLGEPNISVSASLCIAPTRVHAVRGATLLDGAGCAAIAPMHAAASCAALTTAIELRHGRGEHAPTHGTRLPSAQSSAASDKRGSGTTGRAPSNDSLLLEAEEPHGSVREEAVLVLHARQPGWAKGDASRPPYALRHTQEAHVKRVWDTWSLGR